MKWTKKHWIILLILLTEVLGFSLILPFLPFYAQEMGASTFQVGLLLTVFSFFQFIAAPIAGRLSDIYGRKPLLILSQLSTFISFIILAISHQLWMLFLSRIVDGLLGSNGTIAQAYLSDISNKKDRSQAFGLSGVAFGMGFMVGPLLGGTLSQINYAVPAYLAAAMSLISIVLTIALLPETIHNHNQQKLAKLQIKIIDLDQIKKHLSQPRIRQQLVEFATYVLAHVLWASNFSLYANQKVGINPQQIGVALTMVGTISIIIRGVLLPKLINLTSERKLERIGVASMIIGLILSAVGNNRHLMLIAVLFFAAGTGLTRPLMMGDISRSVNEKEQGAIMGVANSINSLGQIIGPLLGGLMLSLFFTESHIILAIGIMLFSLNLLLKEKKQF